MDCRDVFLIVEQDHHSVNWHGMPKAIRAVRLAAKPQRLLQDRFWIALHRGRSRTEGRHFQ